MTMAHRKLQQEVDRVFKKIGEGMETFNELYDRHEMSSNQTQRDKLENDLKKEIKKLQRLREQIKVWQTSNEVKDKDSLLRNRKLVETAMEKYKQVEKDSKHKAYSKEGLTQPEQLSPAEQHKNDTIEYVNKVLEELQIQSEGVEAEIAKLSNGGRKSKKNVLSAKDQDRKAELDEIMDMVRFHQQNLELVLRLVQNGKLEASAVDDLRDDLQYFLETNQEPDFMYDDSIYESLGLEARDNILAHDVKTSFDGIVSDGRNEEEEEATPSPTAAKKPNSLRSTTVHVKPESVGSFSSSVSIPSVTQLKPAPVPVRTVDKKWADAAAKLKPKEEKKAERKEEKVEEKKAEEKKEEEEEEKKEKEENKEKKEKPAEEKRLVAEEKRNVINGNGSSNGNGKRAEQAVATSTSAPAVAPVAASVAPNSASTAAGAASNSAPDVPLQPIVISQQEIDLERDEIMALVPPGIQCFVESFVESRSRKSRKPIIISNASQTLENPRSKLPVEFKSVLLPIEFALYNAEWDLARSMLPAEENGSLAIALSKASPLFLFFGYYFGLSSAERLLCKKALFLKNWRLYNNNVFWFLKIGPATTTADHREISSYEVFDVMSWSKKTLANYQLDLTQLVPVDLS